MSRSGKPVDVSVIIPTYNRARLVAEAIESVLRQTAPPREIIVVDDGSTDDTLERLVPYQAHIKLVKTHHGGAPHARNAGIRAAKGKYISFLDSDDRYLPHKLALQVQILEMCPDVGLVYSEFSGFGEGVQQEFHLKTYHAPAFRNGETYDYYFDKAMSLKEVGIDCAPWSGQKIYFGHIFDRYLTVLFVFVNSILVRREVLDAIGFHDESLSLFDGYDLVLRIAKRNRIAFVDMPTYQLRYHDDQISTTKRADGSEVLVAKQRQLLSIVERHGALDETYYRANKGLVDSILARLHWALAVALMCHPGHDSEARKHFVASRRYGRPVHGLWVLTFLPSIVRRIIMKLRELIN